MDYFSYYLFRWLDSLEDPAPGFELFWQAREAQAVILTRDDFEGWDVRGDRAGYTTFEGAEFNIEFAVAKDSLGYPIMGHVTASISIELMRQLVREYDNREPREESQ